MKYNLYKMMCLDIYLSSLNKTEYEAVSKTISKGSRIITPLTSWDIYSQGNIEKLQEAERLQDIRKVKSYAKKMNWDNDIDFIFEKETFEAILITDLKQKIIWVNKGFTKMTGYLKREVLNKTPRVLQGSKTSDTSRSNIKEKLKTNLAFTEVITNYKKDGTPYKCEVKIFPLKVNNKKTHFVALERQVA
ncbi:PAS domain-containing protein [Hyunsoonleella flava]|uniref:PAS domain-containing protein n=1 Tax=Hyunsoonleella flava TaxID=2527939 RepID=A0A4Q9FKE4_9FLAO|nr:PAS domain-containing protein [Hyunsoonleella flava]TBN04758.1 PAS domain-containing protein [Hyunsoonleella flava]